MKRQYQPSKIRRKRQHGFLKRNSTKSGRATLRNRRRAGRHRLDPGLTRMAGTPSPQLSFPRSSRLKRPGQFARAKAEGRRLVCGCLIANVLPRPHGQTSRLGVVTSKRIGGAVARSRARRLLRECFRLHQRELARPVDLVLVARPSIAGKKLADVEMDLMRVLRQARLDLLSQ